MELGVDKGAVFDEVLTFKLSNRLLSILTLPKIWLYNELNRLFSLILLYNTVEKRRGALETSGKFSLSEFVSGKSL